MANNGYNTAARSRILAFLKENSDRTVNANDILRMLNEHGNDVNITTIYRYLDKLTESGEVMKYIAENGTRAVFQYVGNCCYDYGSNDDHNDYSRNEVNNDIRDDFRAKAL